MLAEALERLRNPWPTDADRARAHAAWKGAPRGRRSRRAASGMFLAV